MVSVEKHRHRNDSPWTYERLDQRQREIAVLAAAGEPGALMLSELAPVVTYGRRTPGNDFLLSSADFEKKGVALHAVDRGGLATYHGPGQWVLFPVDRLERLTGDRRGVRKLIRALLEIAREVARDYDPCAEIREGAELGVWGKSGKLAAVGIHVKDGVVLHGLSVNGYRTEESFVGLKPCGLDLPVGFLLEGVPPGDKESAFELLGAKLETAALNALWDKSWVRAS